jgi:hypothetical protein
LSWAIDYFCAYAYKYIKADSAGVYKGGAKSATSKYGSGIMTRKRPGSHPQRAFSAGLYK